MFLETLHHKLYTNCLFYDSRDRELQIARIEEERHKVREKELGKNYLLETYLNGLHEAEDRDVTTGMSRFIKLYSTDKL